MTSAATRPHPPTDRAHLLDRALPAVLTTHLPGGRLRSTVVWFQREGDHLLVNTMREFRKARNMSARPRATLLVVEPGGGRRWIEARARVVRDGRDAGAHLDALALRYTGATPYFGAVVPAGLARTEHPVVFRLVPVAVCAGPRSLPGPAGTPIAPAPPARPRPCRDEPGIPESHRDLLERPLLGALATRMPDGHAQTQPVWCSLDGNDVLVNTTRQRRKGRNLAADPRATILCLDPEDSGRWIEIRGDVDLVESGAEAHLDALTRAYTGHQRYYGGVYPATQRRYETRVIARIHPRHITCDAIHR